MGDSWIEVSKYLRWPFIFFSVSIFWRIKRLRVFFEVVIVEAHLNMATDAFTILYNGVWSLQFLCDGHGTFRMQVHTWSSRHCWLITLWIEVHIFVMSKVTATAEIRMVFITARAEKTLWKQAFEHKDIFHQSNKQKKMHSIDSKKVVDHATKHWINRQKKGRCWKLVCLNNTRMTIHMFCEFINLLIQLFHVNFIAHFLLNHRSCRRCWLVARSALSHIRE